MLTSQQSHEQVHMGDSHMTVDRQKSKSVCKNTQMGSLFLVFSLRIRTFMLIKPVKVDEKASNQSPA